MSRSRRLSGCPDRTQTTQRPHQERTDEEHGCPHPFECNCRRTIEFRQARQPGRRISDRRSAIRQQAGALSGSDGRRFSAIHPPWRAGSQSSRARQNRARPRGRRLPRRTIAASKSGGLNDCPPRPFLGATTFGAAAAHRHAPARQIVPTTPRILGNRGRFPQSSARSDQAFIRFLTPNQPFSDRRQHLIAIQFVGRVA